MVTPKINENNYRQFVEQISESRKAWAKNVSDSAIIIMERQRHLMGLSLLKFYGEFLGCATEEIAKHFGKYFGMTITKAKYSNLEDFKIITNYYEN